MSKGFGILGFEVGLLWSFFLLSRTTTAHVHVQYFGKLYHAHGQDVEC